MRTTHIYGREVPVTSGKRDPVGNGGPTTREDPAKRGLQGILSSGALCIDKEAIKRV